MIEASATAPDRTLQGIGWMVFTTLCFVTVTCIVRHLGNGMPAAEGAFIRYLIGLIMLLPLAGPLVRNPPGRRAWTIYTFRSLVHAIAVMLWFYAMARVPIAEVTAIGYTAPIYVALGAALFLGESMKLRRIIAILVAFAGTLIILRPGVQEISPGHLAQVIAAPCFACSFLIAKRMTDTIDATSIVIMLSLGCTVFLFPVALADWVDPSWDQIGWLALTAVFATAGHWSMTRAFGCAPITVTQPVGFLQLVWATMLGMAIFGEPVDPWVLIGGAVVIGSATYISHREAVAARKARTPPAAATKI
ncbi:MAG: DMT family transporter [Pseudomonadota bacterium]